MCSAINGTINHKLENVGRPSEISNKFDVDLRNFVFGKYETKDIIYSKGIYKAVPEYGVDTSKMFDGMIITL
jgi:hypothetical protein